METLTHTPTDQELTPNALFEKLSEISTQVERLNCSIGQLLDMSKCDSDSPVRTLEGASSFLKISDSQTRRLVTAGKLRARPLDPDKKSSRLFFDVQDLLQFHYLRHNRRLSKSDKVELNDLINRPNRRDV
jgi:hypothetical protein